MQEKEIVELYWARNEDAIRESEAAFGAACRRMALHVLGNPSDAEDCVNDAWLRTWNSIPPNRPSALGAYILQIVRRLAVNRLRAAKAQRRPHGLQVQLDELAECIPAEAEESEDLTEYINGFLSSLTAEERNLFVGRYWHNYTPEELAEAYGLSRNAVNLRMKRLRERLRKYLGERGYQV